MHARTRTHEQLQFDTNQTAIMTRCIPHNAQYTQLRFPSRFISIEMYAGQREEKTKPVYSLFGIVLFPFIHSFFLSFFVCVLVFYATFELINLILFLIFFKRFVIFFNQNFSSEFFSALFFCDLIIKSFVVLTISTKLYFIFGKNVKSSSPELARA